MKKMVDAGKKAVKSDYNLFTNNCMDAVSGMLKAAGLNGHKPKSWLFASPGYLLPNYKYTIIKTKNKGTEIDLNSQRKALEQVPGTELRE